MPRMLVSCMIVISSLASTESAMKEMRRTLAAGITTPKLTFRLSSSVVGLRELAPVMRR